MKPVTLDLGAPLTWPVRMVPAEVAQALRISLRTLQRRIVDGRVPDADEDGTWPRASVIRYVEGGNRSFERMAAKSQLRMVSR